MTSIESRLLHHVRNTGMPVRDLKRLCLRAGLDQLDRGDLVIRHGETSDESLKPLWLPAKIVDRLAETGHVADLMDPDTELAESILESFVTDPAMLKDNILYGYDLEDRATTEAALDAMIERWEAEDKAVAK